ncbi:hypothetical protein [Burkholderia stagnalis]|uniref:hypothetical protein n=1 Tax=Burkholderia stagnalis TaxID=1503054 RepID=UPI00075F955C|nr:hypothetical protein [Burkholderia stagnalis]KWK60935.1 hypothetical protein WT82_29955 [Burkholderia stagnalis]
MKTIFETDLKQAATAGSIKDFIIEEVETGYILLALFNRSNVEHILFTQRGRARTWVNVNSLIEFIVQYKPELPEVRIRLMRRSNDQ